MNQGAKDEIKGTLHEVKGAVKAEVGKLTHNPKLTAEGEGENLAGKVEKTVGKAERAIGK